MGSGSSVQLPQRTTFDFQSSIEIENSNYEYPREMYLPIPEVSFTSNGTSQRVLEKDKFDIEQKCALTYMISRKAYKSSDISCCINNILVDNSDYCFPGTSSVFTNDICDSILQEYCYSGSGDPLCTQWFESYLTRNDDYNYVLKMAAMCSEDYTVRNCRGFLTALKHLDVPMYNLINDNIIKSPNNIKNNLCLNPPQNIIDENAKKRLPLDCWYQGCTNQEYWQLTTEQIKSRSTCSIAFCSINLGKIEIDTHSKLNLTCESGFNQNINKTEKFKSITYRNEQYQSLMNIPDLHYLVFLMIIILLLLYMGR